MEILEALWGAMILLVVIVLATIIFAVARQLLKLYRISRDARIQARKAQESEAFENGIRLKLLEEGFSAGEVDAALRKPKSKPDGL